MFKRRYLATDTFFPFLDFYWYAVCRCLQIETSFPTITVMVTRWCTWQLIERSRVRLQPSQGTGWKRRIKMFLKRTFFCRPWPYSKHKLKRSSKVIIEWKKLYWKFQVQISIQKIDNCDDINFQWEQKGIFPFHCDSNFHFHENLLVRCLRVICTCNLTFQSKQMKKSRRIAT